MPAEHQDIQRDGVVAVAGGSPARVPLSASVGKDLVQAIVEDLAGTLWISVRGGDDHVERLTAGAWSRWQPPPALEGAAQRDRRAVLVEEDHRTEHPDLDGGGLVVRSRLEDRLNLYRQQKPYRELLAD